MGPTLSFTTCPDTFYIRSTNGGTTWGTAINVANSGAAIAGRNDVAVAGASSVVINFNRAAENTDDANPHLFIVRSADDGATWGTPLQLTSTPGTSDHGSIIGYRSAVHLVWHDSRDGKLAIYYVHSTDDGQTWKPDERVSTTTSAESSTPLNAATPNFVHVAWLDKRSGSQQIYYRRRVAPAVPGAPDGSAPINEEGTPAVGDAGVTPGAGSASTSPTSANALGDSDSGCGCRIRSPSGGAKLTVAGAIFAVAAALRRRRNARKR